MLTLFANPFAMIAGVLLVSSPIIIHLINRMRFKRVRWAAMEFLLKSQKRSRRKLIIEQLILLLLRILMVLLAGLLLARFVGCDDAGVQGQNTFHVIIIDDTLSMSDTVRTDDGGNKEVFAEAKTIVADKIALPASQASNPQFATVIRLSDLDQPRPFGRLNAVTVDEMKAYLNPYKPTLYHVNLVDGLKAAQTLFEAERNMKPMLHIVSDFRSSDWGDRNKEALGKAFDELKTAGVNVHLLDAASPERTDQNKTPLANDNLAIVDLVPEARIVPKNKELDFTVRVRNYSNSEKKGVVVRVRVNGEIREDGTVSIPSVPPNGDATAKFNLANFRRGAEDETDEVGTPDRFNLVSAHLEGETSGLAGDNVRYTVVEVRDRVPMLIIDSNPAVRGTAQAESFFLQKLFTEPIKGYDVQVRSPNELETLNLQQYVSIFICDIPRFTPNALRNLEDYARSGGGVSFFMGPSMKADTIAEYNEKLYRKGEGLFPVPLDKVNGADISPEQRSLERMKRLLTAGFNKKLLVKNAMHAHPALEKLYKDNRGQVIKDDDYERFFIFVILDRYVTVNQQALLTGPGAPETLIFLQNNKSMDLYAPRVIGLTDKFPAAGIDKFAPYHDTLQKYRTQLRQTVAGTGELYLIGEVLDGMLNDQGDEATRRAGLKTFWAMSENATLRQEAEKLRDEVKYGDPLYVSRAFGKGRVTAFMSSAGASWNDLEGPGKPYYPPLMINMQGYLASSGTDVNLVLRSPFEFLMDRNAYDSKVKKWHLAEDAKANKSAFKPLGEEVMATDDKAASYRLTFTKGDEPGVYAFKFLERRGGDGKADGPAKSEYRAIAYNIDAEQESNLARAGSDDLTQISKGMLHSKSTDDLAAILKQRRRDLSENPWIYFVFLLVLIAEQAMAVRLSFHTRGSEAAPAPAPRPAFA